MSFFGRTVAAIVATAMLGSAAFAAETVRPSSSLSAVGTPVAPLSVPVGTRIGSRVGNDNGLLGAPLLIFFLGAVVVTIGTVIIVNNSDNPHSP